MREETESKRAAGSARQPEYQQYSDKEVKSWLRDDQLSAEERRAILNRLNRSTGK